LKLDILAFGIHPDDVELGAGGFLALESTRGRQCGIIDLTRGEMGNNGTPEIRIQEAETSAKILGMKLRRNLGLRDRGLAKENSDLVTDVVREFQPNVVLLPYWEDRHPDHCLGSKLVEEGVFNAGLGKYTGGSAWKPKSLFYYFINSQPAPSFLVDVSSAYSIKSSALAAHRSQFSLEAGQVQTRLNSGLLYLIESRDSYNGAQIGVQYAEGFVLKQPLAIADPVGLLGEII
jgi:N-acetylglucosamine malate deacetylase 1